MRCDFITLYKKEYIDKFIKNNSSKSSASSKKKANVNPYVLPDEQEYF